MIKRSTVFLKIIGLIACSLCGVINFVALFIVSKKLNSKILKVFSRCLLIGCVLSFIVCIITDTSSTIYPLAVLCFSVTVFAPTVLTLFNIIDYKIAHDIAEIVETRNINLIDLADADLKQINNTTWIKAKQIKIARQLYGDKGIAVLIEIDNQEKKRLSELAEKAEKEKKDKEQRKFELAKIKAEKEKAEAEAKTLQMKTEIEQREFELARIKAEKEKAEAEARILQMKKEEMSKSKFAEENNKGVADRPEKTDKYVFISYSTKDRSIAAKTKEILENSGINCWIAPESITAGSDYASEIPKALNGCSAVVLLLSKSSQESKWVPKEIGIAIENGKIIIPFQIDNEIISDSFNFYLTNSQRIAAFNRMNDAYDELTQCLYRLLQIN